MPGGANRDRLSWEKGVRIKIPKDFFGGKSWSRKANYEGVEERGRGRSDAKKKRRSVAF